MFKVQPGVDHIDGQAAISRVMLWSIAARTNERLGLGLDAAERAWTTKRHSMREDGSGRQFGGRWTGSTRMRTK
jgi:hypothetical protein